MPIDAMNGLSGVFGASARSGGNALPISRRRSVAASPRMPRCGPIDRSGRCPSGRLGGRHRLRRDRDVGAGLDVRLDQLAEVHPVEVIAREDQVVVGVERAKWRAAWRTASAVP